MSVQDSYGQHQITGTVKWFDPAKGFGFITPDHGGQDILFYSDVLRTFGKTAVVEGIAIEVIVQETPKGLRATRVMAIAAPSGGLVRSQKDIVEGLSITPARVKWYDSTKGFGFANAFGSDDDIFMHVDVLRRCGFSHLQSGEAIGLCQINGSKGPIAVEIVDWTIVTKR
jgi:CspA family cold shock protein